MKYPLPTALALTLSTTTLTAQTWYPANEPSGGRALMIQEAADGALLCGTLRGLYRSTDNGLNWQDISDGYTNTAVGYAISKPGGLYMATFSYALRRSYDAGQSWDLLPTPDWTFSKNLVVNSSGQIFISTDNSIWRSDDDGDTWTQLTVAANVTQLASLVISPDDELYAGSFNHKIYRSTDNGDTWTEQYTTANDILHFAFDGNDVIYALTSFSGLYKSVDNGDTWTLLPPIPGSYSGGYAITVNAAGTVFVDPYDGGVSQSTDGGMTWTDITSDLIDPAVIALYVNANQDLFAGTRSAGVQLLNGTSWTARNQNLTAVRMNRLESADGVLYACTEFGVFISSDAGQTWQPSIHGLGDPDIQAVAKAANGDLYAGSEQLYRSTDNGANWTDISQPFPGGEVFVNDLLTEPGGRLVVATDEYGIRYTDDQGQSWTYANDGLDDVTMTFIRKAANGYYFTADGYNLYRSNDLTGMWEVINTGLTDTDIEDFAVGNGKLFAVTYSDGMFASSNNGDTWSLAIDEDFTNITVNGNEVYGSSENVNTGGVHLSTDNGVTWNNIVAGLPGTQVEEVHYMQGVGLFARVRDHGLYTLDFDVNGIGDVTSSADGLSCYPNPFTDAATIRVELPQAADVIVTISDLQGRTVQRIAPLRLAPGMHDLRVGGDLAPGVYLITAEWGAQMRTIRLVKGE